MCINMPNSELEWCREDVLQRSQSPSLGNQAWIYKSLWDTCRKSAHNGTCHSHTGETRQSCHVLGIHVTLSEDIMMRHCLAPLDISRCRLRKYCPYILIIVIYFIYQSSEKERWAILCNKFTNIVVYCCKVPFNNMRS